MEKIEPRPLTTTSRLVLAAGGREVVVVGYQLDRFDTALIGLAIGVAETTARPAYRRALATQSPRHRPLNNGARHRYSPAAGRE